MSNNKDWTGNNKAVFTCNGASNHSDGEREIMDYYATEPSAKDKYYDSDIVLEADDYVDGSVQFEVVNEI